MEFSMDERKAFIKVKSAAYRKASKKDKGAILDEAVNQLGYHRRYVMELFRWHGKVEVVSPHLKLKGDIGKACKRTRKPTYGADVAQALAQLWWMMDCLCGKRMKAIMPQWLDALTRHGEDEFAPALRAQLLCVSAATIDRLLAPERHKFTLHGRAGTRPGSMLKHHIAIRTYADWDDQRAGFVEMDLVGHEGGISRGDFCQTLDVIDVASGWCEQQAVPNKAQTHVFAALQTIRQRLPFALLGVDSDNGSEFINYQLVRYCEDERITFTRGRSGKKNDGCFVEQKNYSIVRRFVGYARYDSAWQLRTLNELYAKLRLYTNFFHPVVKLQSKQRIATKVKKTYDPPLTPYQRLLLMPSISQSVKQDLQAQYLQLNPAKLHRDIAALQQRLLRSHHPTPSQRPAHSNPATHSTQTASKAQGVQAAHIGFTA